jgi:CRISPR-associated protein Cas2
MAARTCRLVCYDVRDERRLRAVAKVLEGYGERVQYSIFRCWLTDRQHESLLWRLEQVMEDDDSLLVVPIPAEVERRVYSRNLQTEWERPDRSYALY